MHLQELSAEGGRAREYFFHILANPADELSFWLAGKMLSDPTRSWEKHLEDSIEELYHVPKKSARDALTQIYLDAEQAYTRHLPARMSGTISMEPLVSDKPGPPIYLTKRLSADQRAAYISEVTGIKARAEKLLPEMPPQSKPKMERVIRCLNNVLKDAGSV